MAKTGRRKVGNNEIRWLAHGAPGAHGQSDQRTPGDVFDTLKTAFDIGAASRGEKRLREAQVGALYAALGCRATGDTRPKTIVMPTGVGKTETMLALFVASPCLTLVIVPSHALRQQLANKFVTLGVLPACGIVSGDFTTPSVGLLSSTIVSADECDELVNGCNVVITTAQALSTQDPALRARLLDACQSLLVDEAHHVAASTWSMVIDAFEGRPVTQFTATPFREDRVRLSGEILYSYPLGRAQRDGIFSRINYRSVFDIRDVDRAIAKHAVDALRRDCRDGFDHIVMARVKTITRSVSVLALYEDIAPDLHPVRLDSRMGLTEQRQALTEIRQRRSRIIVCVDMLGEGFDMPQLKIAAIHDPHKSLAVTLQFIGRFTRAGGAHVGDASIIVPREVYHIDERLQQLYAENSDWNEVVRDLTEIEVAKEHKRDEFDRAFGTHGIPVPMRVVRPKMSTVVYRSSTLEWNPETIEAYVGKTELLGGEVAINNEAQVLWFVTVDASPVRWGNVPALADVSHTLHVVHADRETGLLYINSSANEGVYEDLAGLVGGSDVELLCGDQIFRVLHHLKRRVATNVGLLDAISINRRFSFLVGGDTLEAFGPTAAQKMKTNVYVTGFADGIKTSVGASRKGRIWTHLVANDIHAWMGWARHVGQCVTDESIAIESVLSGFLPSVRVTERPLLVPLGVELDFETLSSTAVGAVVVDGDEELSLLDADITLDRHDDHSPIDFVIAIGDRRYPIRMTFGASRPRFEVTSGDDPVVVHGRRDFVLSTYLNKHGVTIYLEREAVITEDGFLVKPDREALRINPAALEVADWSGIDITKESQGRERRASTVQYRSIEILSKEQAWDFIVDDDGSGETADIVLIRADLEVIDVLLVHCKYSSKRKPGGRLADLYEVCGQAMKSYKARSDLESILKNLIRRERNRFRKHGASGFEVGKAQDLANLLARCRTLRPSVSVAVVQPGLSKAKLNQPLSEVLGGVDNYLKETCQTGLRVICSR